MSILHRVTSAVALSLIAALAILSLAACVTLEVGIEPTSTTEVEPTPTLVASLPVPNVAATPTETATANLSPTDAADTPTATSTESLLPSPSQTRATTLQDATQTPVSSLAGLIYGLGDSLWQIDIVGQAVRLLYQPGAIVSPDGKRALFASAANKDDKLADLWLADLASGEAHNLSRTPDRVETHFQWWPARPELIVMASGSAGTIGEPGLSGLLTAIGTDGTGYQVLDEQHPVGGKPALSPDGLTIAYGAGALGWLYHMDTSTATPFDPAEYGLNSYAELYIGNPAWSPDGRRLAWVVNGRSAGKAGSQMGIAVFNLETRDVQLLHLYQPLGMDGFPPAPVWSPDGRWISFVAAAETPQDAGVWVARADGQAADEFGLGLGSNPVWSPAGDMLALNLPTKDWRPAAWIARAGTWVPELAALAPDALLADWRALDSDANIPGPTAQPIPSPTPPVTGWATFTSERFGVSLAHPSDWQPMASDSLETRYEAKDGFFVLGALVGESIDLVTKKTIENARRPYGLNPTIEIMDIGGQEARLILPSADHRAGAILQAELIVRYFVPVVIEGQECPFFSLVADLEHMRDIIASLRFKAMEQGDFAELTEYAGLNDIRDVVFADDGALWAATDRGVVKWNLDQGSYVRYSTADGLISDDVLDLALAPDGTLWVATRGGASVFDGAKWFSYGTEDGLASAIVNSVAVAPEGTVWVGTQAGASHFDGVKWTSFTTADGLAGDLVWSVAVDPAGKVWFSTHEGGLSRYDPDQDIWRTYGVQQGLPALNARIVAAGPDGAIWLHVGYNDVYRLDGDTWRVAYESGGGTWVCGISFDGDGLPWIATCGGYRTRGVGLAHYDGAEWLYLTASDGILDNEVTAVAVAPDGTIAAGTRRGISSNPGGEWRALRAGPLSNKPTALASTPDGAAWFAYGDQSASTPGYGISTRTDGGWRYYMENTDVQVLASAPDGSLWVGASCDLLRYDGQAWETLAKCGDALPPGSIREIAFARDGTTWVATTGGLASFDGNAWTIYDELKLVHDLLPAPDGAIWMNGWEGTEGSAFVARFDGQSLRKRSPFETYPRDFEVRALTPDGMIWGISTGRGLARFDGGDWSSQASWRFYPTVGHMAIDSISAFEVGPDGSLWIGTVGGIARFDGQSWVSKRINPALGPVEDIAFGYDGLVWLATATGAFSLQW